MLFFAQDRLQATQEQIALFLVLYFVSGALSMPGWLRVVRRWGLERAWLGGMLLAIACFRLDGVVKQRADCRFCADLRALGHRPGGRFGFAGGFAGPAGGAPQVPRAAAKVLTWAGGIWPPN